MNIHELEARLRAHLGQPGWGTPQPLAREKPLGDWNDLAHLIADMRREAERIGTVPEKYPRHVDLIIRVVHALLPWYTRPLRRFSEDSARAFEELAGHVSEMARDQHRILGRLDHLERNLAELRGRQAR